MRSSDTAKPKGNLVPAYKVGYFVSYVGEFRDHIVRVLTVLPRPREAANVR